MKKIILIKFILLGALSSYSQSFDLDWFYNLGGYYKPSIAIDASGNVLTAGTFTGTLDFDPGAGTHELSSLGTGQFVQKLDDSKNLVWASRVNAASGSIITPKAIHVDTNGDVYVAGTFNNSVIFDPEGTNTTFTASNGADGFLMKYNSSGVFQWVKQFYSTSGQFGIEDMVVTSTRIYIIGTHNGQITMDPAGSPQSIVSVSEERMFFVKLDKDGIYQSGYSTLESADVEIKKIVLDQNDNLAIVGSALVPGTIQLGGTNSLTPSTIGTTAFVLRVSSTTDEIFDEVLISTVTEKGITAIDFADNGEFYIGWYSDNSDTDTFVKYIAKYSSSGVGQWTISHLSSTYKDRLIDDVVVDGTDVYVVTSFTGTVDVNPDDDASQYETASGTDGLILKLDTDGAFQEATIFESVSSSTFLPRQLIIGDNIYLSGSLNGSVDADPSGTTQTIPYAGGGITLFKFISPNSAPSDISLVGSTINENNSVNATVGTLSTSDADVGDSHTYSLVGGTGSTDNASFQISGSQLQVKVVTNFEVKPSYSIRLQTSDGNGGTYSEAFTVSVNDVNEAPTNVSLSSTDIDENSGTDDPVGSFTVTDQDDGDTHTISLVKGVDDDDNALFAISKGSLLLKAGTSHEQNATLKVRLRVTDRDGLNLEKPFTITINDVPEAPTNILLNSSDVNENLASGTIVGTLSSTDEDEKESYTYSLVGGTGSTDNSSFTITGSQLKTNGVFDFETKPSYSIRINTNDGNGFNYARPFTISVNDDTNEPLIWNGTSWANGTPGAGSDDVIIAADYNTEVEGFIEVNSMVINSGITFTVASDDHLYVVTDIENNGSLVIESGGDLMTFESGTITGNDITIRRNTRYADGRYSFVGTPMEQSANNTNATIGSHVYAYDETQSYTPNEGLARWVDMIGNLVPGIGYTQAFQQEIIFVGMPNVSAVNVQGTYTGTYDDGAGEATEGWFLVANPFATAIDVADFLGPNSNIEGAVYIWDDNGSDNGRGTNADYIIANGSVATNTTPAGGQSRYDQVLASAQGFFVKLADDTDTEVSFTPDMRVTGSNSDDNFFRKASTPSHVRINLTNEQGLFKQAIIGWVDGINEAAVDRSFDARVFSASASDLIYTLKAGSALAIQGISFNHESVPLGINVAEAGIYTLALDLTNANGEGFYLRDNDTKQMVDLSSESYTFSSGAGQFADRFELLSGARILGLAEQNLQVYAHDQSVFVKIPDGEARTIEFISMDGQRVLKRILNRSTEISTNLPAGVYIVTDGVQSHKIILK